MQDLKTRWKITTNPLQGVQKLWPGNEKTRAIVPENSSEVSVDVSFISSFEGLFECPFLTPLIDLDVVELLVWDKSKVEHVHFITVFEQYHHRTRTNETF